MPKQEHDVILDHEYDGIQEYDNPMPGWWVWIFVVSCFFSLGYVIFYYPGGNGATDIDDYKQEMKIFKAAKAKLQLRLVGKVSNKSLVKLFKNPALIAQGKQIYNRPNHCALCHLKDGGGNIGPNLTDAHWINAKSSPINLMAMYQFIADGGRPGKGMVAWKKNLSAQELISVTLYTATLSGTKPAKPKKTEGKKWGLVETGGK